MALGLFGGEFDPPHRAHVRVAREALRQARLGRLLVAPNSRPPHRPRASAPFADRIEMLRIAMADVAGAEISGVERDPAAGPHRTIDTVRRLLDSGRADHVVLVVGADSAALLDEWAGWRELAGMCGWLIAPRAGTDFPACARPVVLEELRGAGASPEDAARRPGVAAMLDMEPLGPASSALRAALASGDPSADGMLPPGVAEYARGRRLYE